MAALFCLYSQPCEREGLLGSPFTAEGTGLGMSGLAQSAGPGWQQTRAPALGSAGLL